MTSAPSNPSTAVCRPFTWSAFHRWMVFDTVFRGTLLVLLLVVLVGSLFPDAPPNQGIPATLIVLVALWLWLNFNSARTSQSLVQLTDLLETDPARAAALLATALPRWPLPRALRLLLYYRLAVLRHRQQRYEETAAICAAVLQYRLGAADPLPGGGFNTARRNVIGPIRAHLLLMLTDSHLQRGDTWSAYQALAELHRGRLGQLETLQRLLLQTRYELVCGHEDMALAKLPEKLHLAELMPAAQCGTLHVLFALAAARRGQNDLAQWLRRRAELLCTPEQLRGLETA